MLIFEFGDQSAEITVLEPGDYLPDDIVERPLVEGQSAIAGGLGDDPAAR